MTNLFRPKTPPAVPIVDPAQTQNRLNEGLANQLQAGGSNADNTSGGIFAPVGGARSPTLTGSNP